MVPDKIAEGPAREEPFTRGQRDGCRGALPIVRVAANRPEYIQAALDSGAGGVQVPGVQSAADARSVVRAACFAPKGQRGVCRYVRAGIQYFAYGTADGALTPVNRVG